MTQQRPGDHPDELISASLTGELSEAERAQLAVHLADCEACRQTMAAFAESRRLVSGMRHLEAPRDLGARVRAGIESGRFAPLPWWRRPGLLVGVGASLATVTAAVMAVVVFSNLPRPPVAQSPSASSTGSIVATASLDPSLPASSAGPTSTTPPPSTPPILAQADPSGSFVWTVQDANASLELATADGTTQIPVEQHGTPVDADLSPDGDWVAFQLLSEGQGLVDTYAYRISDGTLVTLGQDTLPSPFARFAWTPRGDLLAYTLVDEDGAGGLADVWIFDPQGDAGPQRLTDSGSAFAGSFYGASDTEGYLTVSVAGQDPVTYLVPVPTQGSTIAPLDPAAASQQISPGVFLPMLNEGAESGSGFAALWRGEMARDAAGWQFVRGGMMYMKSIEGRFEDLGVDGTQVFSTLSIQPGGAAFASARFEWAPDGDGFAIWDARWSAPAGDGFPAADRVYYGHLFGSGVIGPDQALDAADTEGSLEVVDVALGGGQYLAITLRIDQFQGNEFAPTSELRLITRNTGTIKDEVRTVGEAGVWNGPALYPATLEPGG